MANQKSNSGTGVFLAHLAVLACLVVVLSITAITYFETKWMQSEIKKEAKELRKLKTELEGKSDVANSRLNRSKPD